MAGNKGLVNGGRHADARGKDGRTYERKLTVIAEIEGEDVISTMELLKAVKEECREVIGCQLKSPKEYELTMRNVEGKTNFWMVLR